jgi:hypothetical protein
MGHEWNEQKRDYSLVGRGKQWDEALEKTDVLLETLTSNNRCQDIEFVLGDVKA